MGFGIFDYSDGDMAWKISDNMAVDGRGNTMLRIGNNQAVDTRTGEMHIVSDWAQQNSWDSWDNEENDVW